MFFTSLLLQRNCLVLAFHAKQAKGRLHSRFLRPSFRPRWRRRLTALFAFSCTITYAITREKQGKLLGGGAIADGTMDAQNASVDGPLPNPWHAAVRLYVRGDKEVELCEGLARALAVVVLGKEL
jgi:hypothetical protein